MKNQEERKRKLKSVEKFEKMLENEADLFFDIDVFEEIGEYYFENSDFEKAIILCNYALSLFPGNELMTLLKGHALLMMGKISEAKDLVFLFNGQSVISIDVLLLKAAIHSRLKEHKKAVICYLSVLEKASPTLKIEVSFDLVMEYQLVNDYTNAIKLLKGMLIEYPDNEAAQFELAFCLDKEQKIDDAIDLFSDFVDSQPYSYTGWFNLGNFLLKSNRIDDALEAYELSCAIKTDYVPSIINCAMIKIINKEYGTAIQLFKEVLSIEKDNDFVLCAIAEAYEVIGEYRQSIHYYEKAVEVNPFSVDGLLGLAFIYREKEKLSKALTYVTRAWELDKQYEGAVLLLAQIKMDIGDGFEAEDLLVDFLSDNPDSLYGILELADYYFYYLDDIILAFEVLDDGVFGKIDEKHVLVTRKATYLHIAGQHQSAYNELNFLLSFFGDKDFIVSEIGKIYPDMMMDENVLRILL